MMSNKERRIMPSSNVHILTPRTCDSVPSHGKRDLAHAIRISRWRAYFAYLGGLHVVTRERQEGPNQSRRGTYRTKDGGGG